MALTKDNVAHIAKLARLDLPEADLAPMAEELSNILNWIEQLNEVDVDGVEPMTSVVEMALRWRADRVTDGGYPDDIVANAPESADGFFVVPKVIE